MKLVSLNTWAGKVFGPLIKFVEEQGRDTDIFCFQEIFDTPTPRETISEHYQADIFSKLRKALPNHTGYFTSVQDNCGFDGFVDFPIQQGLAIFVRKSLTVLDMGEIYIFGRRNSRKEDNTTLPRALQYICIGINGQQYTIAHIHGLWTGQGKGDTPERIVQSNRIREFIDGVKGKKVICGDFNLLPDTKSLAILEKDLVNLIKTHNITTTRSSLYKKPERFADYTLVSPGIEIESFKVPQIEVSDHLPMVLEFR